MEHYEISRLLKDSTEPKFETKKRIAINDLSSSQYSVQNLRFKISVLRSDICDYSDAYIAVKLVIDLLAADAN